jgi:DNA-binding IclR family transcriptional regulator
LRRRPDKHNNVRSALSVAGSTYRLTLEFLTLLSPELADAARRGGEQLRMLPAQRYTPSHQEQATY